MDIYGDLHQLSLRPASREGQTANQVLLTIGLEEEHLGLRVHLLCDFRIRDVDFDLDLFLLGSSRTRRHYRSQVHQVNECRRNNIPIIKGYRRRTCWQFLIVRHC